ncbi:hypothetical protein D3C76_894790 [compost metagenome]
MAILDLSVNLLSAALLSIGCSFPFIAFATIIAISSRVISRPGSNWPFPESSIRPDLTAIAIGSVYHTFGFTSLNLLPVPVSVRFRERTNIVINSARDTFFVGAKVFTSNPFIIPLDTRDSIAG